MKLQRLQTSTAVVPVKVEPQQAPCRDIVLLVDDNEDPTRFAGSWDKNGLEAEASWRALGIDHHNVFGAKHGFVMPKNDWKDFCSSISNGKPVQCSVCQELVERARVNKEALQDEDTERGVVEVAALADASGPGSTEPSKARADFMDIF